MKFNTPAEKEAFVYGTECVKDYVVFCMQYYVLDLFKDGSLNFRSYDFFRRDMNLFLIRRATGIPNTRGVDFREFCDNYEKYFEVN